MIEGNLALPHNYPMALKPETLLRKTTANEMRPERIGFRMKVLREALGLKPSEISDMLGVERTYWSRFENGKRPITEGFAALLVDRFGVTLDFLILGRPDGLPLALAEKMRVEQEKYN